MERDNRKLYSSMRFVGDGVTKVVALTFDLRESDGLAVDFGYGLVELGYVVDYDSQPTLVIFDSPLPLGQTITIRRITEISEVPHIFQRTGNAQGGSPYNAKNIDENFENITRASQDAMDSQALASETLEDMSGIRDDAKGYRDEAEESATKAKDSENSARIHASSAMSGATASSKSAEDSKGFSDLAYKWANEDVDVPVVGEEFSAKHWAEKAKDSAGGLTPEVVGELDKKADVVYVDSALDVKFDKSEIANEWGNPPSSSKVLSQEFFRSNLGYVTPEMFGAVGDGVTDDTKALQDAINYCAPFDWKGSISATKAGLGDVRAKLQGSGKYRITETLLLNPFLYMEGINNGGFFGEESGFLILADFSTDTGFILDAAPYNVNGVRELSKIYTSPEWDKGLVTGCMGWVLSNVAIKVKEGQAIYGGINRTTSGQSWVKGCSIHGTHINIVNSACWGGGIAENHLRALGVNIYAASSNTNDNIENNYASLIGDRSNAVLELPSFTDSSLDTLRCNIHLKFSGGTISGNILESSDGVAFKVQSESSIYLNNNYVEGGYSILYALHSVKAHILERYVYANSAKIFHLAYANVLYNLQSPTYHATLKEWGSLKHSSVQVIDILNHVESNIYSDFKYNKSVSLLSPVKRIFVSGSGDDGNTGIGKSSPVKSLQTAIQRLVHHNAQEVILLSDIDTSYYFGGEEVITRTVVNLDSIVIGSDTGKVFSVNIKSDYGEVHCIPRGIRNITLKNIRLKGSLESGAYTTFVRGKGAVTLELSSCIIEGGVCLMGSAYKETAFINAQFTKCEFLQGSVLQSSQGGRLKWIDTITETTFNGSVGDVKSVALSSDIKDTLAG